MKHLFCLTPFACLALATADAAPPTNDKTVVMSQSEAQAGSDHFVFSDKEMLVGTLVSLENETLTWRHPDGVEPFRIKTEHLDRITLAAFSPKAPPADGVCTTLNGGDILHGKLVEYARDKMILDVGNAGRITLSPTGVRSVVPEKNRPRPLISGFGNAADWVVTNGAPGQVKIAEDSLTLGSDYLTVGRAEANFPSKYRVDIEMAGKYPRFELALLAVNPTWYGGIYCLESRSRNDLRLSATVFSENGGSAGYANADRKWRYRADADSFTLCALVDMDARTLTVLVNGQLMETTPIGDYFKTGSHIVLRRLHLPLQFTKFTVSRWSGVLDAPGADVRADTDALTMVNKDHLSGRVLGIKEGRVSFKTEYATVDIPLDQILELEYSGKEAKGTSVDKGDVRVFFNEADCLTLHDAAIRNSRLSGTSALLGSVTVEQRAVRRVEFNLDAPFRHAATADEKPNAAK